MRVLCDGCFDILHVGHVLYLQAAKRMGDTLIVSVTRNAHVNKGPHRPMFDEKIRLHMVRALSCVDEALLVDNSLDALQRVKPDIFVKGKDYIGKIEQKHQDYCDQQGIKIAFTDEPIYSATKIINDRLRTG